MTLNDMPDGQQCGGIVYYNLQGATIHKLVFQGTMTNSGSEYYEHTCDRERQETGYSDEAIAQAITAINGDNKPLNTKRKWAAVHWFLRWYCNFPTAAKDFCDKIKELPLGDLEYECDYTSIRHFSTLSFMNQDARQIDKVKPSKMDEEFFLQCRTVVVALASELEKNSSS